MLPEVRPHLSTHLTDQLEHQLGPSSETSQLDVERLAGIAVVAAAHSGGYAAIGHLLGLLAALPAPTDAGERFWSDLWRSSGTAYLLPATIKAGVLESLTGEGTTLARQILSAVDEMTPPQRLAAGEVIGQALVESDTSPTSRHKSSANYGSAISNSPPGMSCTPTAGRTILWGGKPSSKLGRATESRLSRWARQRRVRGGRQPLARARSAGS